MLLGNAIQTTVWVIYSLSFQAASPSMIGSPTAYDRVPIQVTTTSDSTPVLSALNIDSALHDVSSNGIRAAGPNAKLLPPAGPGN